MEVRQDGDVVRIELPADRLFNPGMAQLRRTPLFWMRYGWIQRSYPNQIIGIEGTPVPTAPTRSASIISSPVFGAGSPVFDYLVARSRLHQQQFFLVPAMGSTVRSSPTLRCRVRLAIARRDWFSILEQWQK